MSVLPLFLFNPNNEGTKRTTVMTIGNLISVTANWRTFSITREVQAKLALANLWPQNHIKRRLCENILTGLLTWYVKSRWWHGIKNYRVIPTYCSHIRKKLLITKFGITSNFNEKEKWQVKKQRLAWNVVYPTRYTYLTLRLLRSYIYIWSTCSWCF